MSRQLDHYSRNSDTINAERRKLHKYRRQNGLCTVCGVVAMEGKALCSVHYESIMARVEARRIELKTLRELKEKVDKGLIK